MPDDGVKRVLITGGARGIGFHTAREFLRTGHEVILTDIDADRLAEAAAALAGSGGPVHTRVMDVANRAQTDALARWVIEELGGLDILINNAAIGHHGELAEATLETWERLLAVNLMGPLHHIYAFLPHFKQRRAGHIVNIASAQVFFRLPSWGVYTSVKAALAVCSEILHFELRKHGVGVTTVYPFVVNTPFFDDLGGETLAGRLSLQLLPYYSMSPAKVGRVIFRAVQRRTRAEKVHPLNHLGYYLQVLPRASGLLSKAGDLLLNKRPQ